jgi:hypothetical protein
VIEDQVVLEAACAIRPYLPELLGNDASKVDAELSALLEVESGSGVEVERLHRLLQRDEATREWLLEFLDDPAHVPPDVQAVRSSGVQFPDGNPVRAVRYRCPEADHYVWYRRTVTERVAECPDHACTLVSP